jgi:predicted nucleic acid-binding Zn ribbon protein
MKQQPDSIKDILNSVISNISGEKKERIGRIRLAWGKILDKKAQRHVRLTGFKANKLIVNTDSSAWMYEMNLRRQQIKADLDRELKDAKIVVDEIIFRIGDVR